MIALSSAQRYYLCRAPTDMRKSFDGLSAMVRQVLDRNPLSGDVFVFVNRRRTHMKLLVWDRTGFVLFYKRLEAGTFELPKMTGTTGLSWHKLMLMVEGVSMDSVRYRKRYKEGPKLG